MLFEEIIEYIILIILIILICSFQYIDNYKQPYLSTNKDKIKDKRDDFCPLVIDNYNDITLII